MDAGDASALTMEQSADKILGKVVVSVPDTGSNNFKKQIRIKTNIGGI